MMWRRSTASGSVQETSRGVDAFVREPGGELAQRSSSGARLMGSAMRTMTSHVVEAFVAFGTSVDSASALGDV